MSIYRLSPCPHYDVERMESWLQDMAQKGLFLEKDGIGCGLTCFQRGEPKKVHYRLVSRVRPRSLWNLLWFGDIGQGEPPAQEEQDLFAQYGWRYVSKCGKFYVYQAENPLPCEPDSDPIVQAMSITAVRNLEGVSIFNFLLLLVINFSIFLGGSIFMIMAEGLLPYVFAIYTLPLWLVFLGFLKFIYFDRLRRRLETGKPLDHQKPWQTAALRHYIKVTVNILIVLVMVLLYTYTFFGDISGPTYTHYELADYPNDPPFATVADLAPPGEYQENHHLFSSGVTVHGTYTVPVTIRWNEKADVTTPDGEIFTAALCVQYHETAFPWIARGLAADLLKEDRQITGKFWERQENLPLPDLGAHYARAYLDAWKQPAVILQKGNIVIQASFSQSGDRQLTLEEWVTLLWESLPQKNPSNPKTR